MVMMVDTKVPVDVAAAIAGQSVPTIYKQIRDGLINTVPGRKPLRIATEELEKRTGREITQQIIDNATASLRRHLTRTVKAGHSCLEELNYGNLTT
jgi:hypothetical protein